MPLLIDHPPGIPLTCGCGATINDGKQVCSINIGIPCNGTAKFPPKHVNTAIFMQRPKRKRYRIPVRVRIEDVEHANTVYRIRIQE